jgi:hypothetical protein
VKTESAGGSHVPPMVTFAQAANLGASELGAKAYTYSTECVEGKFSELRLDGVLRRSPCKYVVGSTDTGCSRGIASTHGFEARTHRFHQDFHPDRLVQASRRV